MKTFLAILIFILCSLFMFGQTNPKHTHVKGYYRKDGTYVQPHYRTAPNSTNRDNFSTKGNYNPYTGKAGWVDPDNNTQSTPSTTYSNSTYSNSSARYAGTTNSLGQKVITYSNGQETFGLCKDCGDITYNDELDYYWYTPYNGIQKTRGGSSGTLLDGEYKFFKEYGKLLIKSNYKKGVRHWEFMTWDEKGKLKDRLHYTNGMIDYAKFTNDKGHTVEWKGAFLAKGSIQNAYTSDGTLIETFRVGNDYKLHYKLYYEPGGELQAEFTKGVLESYYGSFKIFHQNGNLKFLGCFSDNFRDSTWSWYEEDGTLETSLEYRIYTENHPNGNLRLKGSQYYNPISESWIREGEWIYFEENGTDWAEVKYFEDGIEVEKTE